MKLTIALVFLSNFAVFHEFMEVGNGDEAGRETLWSQVLSNAYVVLFLCPIMWYGILTLNKDNGTLELNKSHYFPVNR